MTNNSQNADHYRKIALWCWALPAVAGVGVFVIILLCLVKAVSLRKLILLALAGEITIAIGIVLSIVGLVCLRIYKKRAEFKWRDRSVVQVLLLLVSNYFLAALLIFVVAKAWNPLSNNYTVEVSNECSDADVKTLNFFDPQGNIHPFESVARGEVIKHFYNFKGEGEVKYAVVKRLKGQPHDMPEQQGTLLGYISVPIEGYRSVTMQFHDSCTGNDCVKDCIVKIKWTHTVTRTN